MDYRDSLERKKKAQNRNRGRLSSDRRHAIVRIREIPINQAHVLKGEHSSKCPSAINPYCDYCICGLNSKSKLSSKKRAKLEKDKYVDPAVQRQREQFQEAINTPDYLPRKEVRDNVKRPYWHQNRNKRNKYGFF